MTIVLHRIVYGAAREFTKGFGRSEEWPGVRRAWLKDHATCAACGGTSLLQVHHVQPFHLHPELELNPENLITLCQGNLCHLYLGHGDDWEFYCAGVRELATQFLVAEPDQRAALIKAAKAARVRL